MLWSVHLCFPFLSDVLPFRAYHSLIIPIGTPPPPPPPMMLLKASGTESPYLPTCCVYVLSGQVLLGQYITYSEVLGEFRQAATFWWFNKQLVLT